MRAILIIPAYQPGPSLIDLLEELTEASFQQIFVVNDGSDPACTAIFDRAARLPRVTVLTHALNMGKGAALKTGINRALVDFPDASGIVTADADGQHAPADIRRVARLLDERPDHLILGVRDFSSSDVPFRSRAGNRLSSLIFRMVLGVALTDTQTGLRGIPLSLAPRLLRIPSNGYEFELDMLTAAKHQSIPIVQQPIETIYIDQNRASHFNPLLDSMRVSFVLLRFSLVSVLTALVDNAVFAIAFGALGIVAPAQVLGRLVALTVNYTLARQAVFQSREPHRSTAIKYLLLVVASGSLSYVLLNFLHESFGLPVLTSKIIAETFLFLANFAIQRDLIFTRRSAQAATDWTSYYSAVPWTAKITRRYTTSVLVGLLQRICADRRPVIAEFGGANSCFFEAIQAKIQPAEYHVIDTSDYGLELLRRRTADRSDVVLHSQDCREADLPSPADVAFSVGLIEHFSPAETRRAIEAHFRVLRPGGWAILSFPTPTLLYRTARGITEMAGLWKFPDERPLKRDEVAQAVQESGDIEFEKILWPLVFTQRVMLVRKRSTAVSSPERRSHAQAIQNA